MLSAVLPLPGDSHAQSWRLVDESQAGLEEDVETRRSASAAMPVAEAACSNFRVVADVWEKGVWDFQACEVTPS